jgi:hypothetical protein
MISNQTVVTTEKSSIRRNLVTHLIATLLLLVIPISGCNFHRNRYADPSPIFIPLPQEELNKLNRRAMEQVQRSPIRSAAVIDIHHVRLNEGRLFDEVLHLPPSRIPPIKFQVSSTVSVTLITDQLQKSDYGLMWAGHIQENPKASMLLRADTNARTISGEIRAEGIVYEIRPSHNKSHAIFTIDTKRLPPDHSPDWNNTDPTNRVPTKLFPHTQEVLSLVLNPYIIDVMVLYTQNAINVDPARSIAGHVCDAMTQIQQSFIDSGITNARLRLVHHQQITFPESGSIEQDAMNFRDPSYPSRAGIQDYFQLRTRHGADLMSLWVGDGNACGSAEVIIQPGGSGALAFSIVRRNCATVGLSFAHELGHLMGTYHDRFDAEAGDSVARNYGYTWPAKNWRTIMGENRRNCQPTCARLRFWSNPAKNYPPPPNPPNLGDPMGRRDDAPRTDCTDRTGDPSVGPQCDGPANNVATINNNAAAVSQFTSTGSLGSISCGPAGDITSPVGPVNLDIR